MIASNQIIDLTTGKHWVCDSKVLCSKFSIVSGCSPIDPVKITDHIVEIDQILEDLRLPFLIDLTASDSILSFDALKVWGQSELLNRYRSAEAYVVNNLADLIFLKQHIRLNDLSYPADVFQSEKLAMDWLVRMRKFEMQTH